MMTRRVFLGMAGVAGAGLWLGVPGLAQAAVSRETKVMLGTFVDVSVAGVSSMQASDALGLAFAEASRLERVFSRHDGGTPVSELNRAGRLRAAPAELVRVVNRSLFYGALTGGSFDVTVQPVSGKLTDHYDPRTKVVKLSDSVYNATSVAAIGVAAHECGHAMQHNEGYGPLRFRSALVPVANFGSQLSWPMILLGILFGGLGSPLVQVGILMFSLAVLFQLVTLPVEFNASSRAVRLLDSQGILSGEEVDGTRKVLKAAALTYVAAAAGSILQLLRLVILFGGRDRDND